MYYYRYSSAGFAGFVGKQNTRTLSTGGRRTYKAGRVLLRTNVPIVDKVYYLPRGGVRYPHARVESPGAVALKRLGAVP